ncbi:MAG: protein TolR [Deltaproteobacteria bacterium]|nr:protein TolR [Deltaproteobacteria bacterium]
MNSGSSNDSLLSDINVTPFVDVMLVLLIIFMVTAPMMTQGVDVALPEANSSALSTDDDPLILSIDKENIIYIDDIVISFSYLKEKVRRIMKAQPGRKVFLKADKDITYGMVAKVMSEIKVAGVENLGMITEPIEEK